MTSTLGKRPRGSDFTLLSPRPWDYDGDQWLATQDLDVDLAGTDGRPQEADVEGVVEQAATCTGVSISPLRSSSISGRSTRSAWVSSSITP